VARKLKEKRTMPDDFEIRLNPHAFHEIKRETEKKKKRWIDALNNVLEQIGDTPENTKRLEARVNEIESGPPNKEWEHQKHKAVDGKADIAAIRRLLDIG